MTNGGTAAIARRATTTTFVLLSIFVLSRAYLAFAAIDFPVATDVENSYLAWAHDIVVEGERAYEEVEIEYPPAALPFLLGPALIDAQPEGYRIGFVALMFLIDVLGFAGLMRIARRHGSLLGPWIWVAAIAILGPLVYLRFDLVPAVATIWFVVRADADDWIGAGAFLGAAIATKAYAVVLIPLALVLCPPKKRLHLAVAAIALIAVPLLPFVTQIGAVAETVLGYHSRRGIQIESLWGSVLFIVRSTERLIFIVHNYGAHHFEGGAVPTVKLAASVATLLVTAVGAWIAGRLPRRPGDLASVSFATLALVVAVASVFSPQFMIWVIALAAAAASYAHPPVRTQAVLVVGIAAVTRWIYPGLHADLVNAENLAIIVVWFRNLALLLTAIYASVRLYESATAPSTRVAFSEGTP